MNTGISYNNVCHFSCLFVKMVEYITDFSFANISICQESIAWEQNYLIIKKVFGVFLVCIIDGSFCRQDEFMIDQTTIYMTHCVSKNS